MTVRSRPTSEASVRGLARLAPADEPLRTLEQELEAERREHHIARAEINRLRRKVVEHAQATERARDTVSYRLGAALLAARTWRGLWSLPFELLALVRESRRRRTEGARLQALSARTAALLDETLDDAAAAVRDVKSMGLAAHDAAVVMIGIANARAAFDPTGAARVAREAVSLDPSPRIMGRAAQILYRAGLVKEPAEYARAALHGRMLFTRGEAGRLRFIEGFAKAAKAPIPPRRRAGFAPRPRRVAFVVSSSLPHHISGYTLRTQNVVGALGRKGWDVQPVTRPGYPLDRNDAREQRSGWAPHTIAGVEYRRLKGPSASATPFPAYAERAAEALCAHFQATRPEVVFAASNYVCGLPALIAARRAGLPFVYSVRGLWEYTAAAKTPGWEATEHFAVQRDLETRVCDEADQVVVLSEGLRRELVARGVSPSKIVLAPNCVDTSAFRPVPKDRKLARRLGLKGRFVLGFLGSLEPYEGVDTLLEAAAMLVEEGLDLAVLIAGEGSVSSHLREEARRLELGDRVVQLGRIPPEEVANHYSVVDVAVFPRKPHPVCEIVAPLKPLEAMAMAKPVIGSDVGGLAEIIEEGRTGLLFDKGDVRALAAVIRRLAADPALGHAIGAYSRAWVEAERSWDVAAAAVGFALETARAETQR